MANSLISAGSDRQERSPQARKQNGTRKINAASVMVKKRNRQHASCDGVAMTEQKGRGAQEKASTKPPLLNGSECIAAHGRTVAAKNPIRNCFLKMDP
jgi:hypothetical protein